MSRQNDVLHKDLQELSNKLDNEKALEGHRQRRRKRTSTDNMTAQNRNNVIWWCIMFPLFRESDGKKVPMGLWIWIRAT